jgi:hypothetical protein
MCDHAVILLPGADERPMRRPRGPAHREADRR